MANTLDKDWKKELQKAYNRMDNNRLAKASEKASKKAFQNPTRTSSRITQPPVEDGIVRVSKSANLVGKPQDISAKPSGIPRDFSNKQLTISPEFNKTYSASSPNLPVTRNTSTIEVPFSQWGLRGLKVGAGALGAGLVAKDLYDKYQTGTLGIADTNDPLSTSNTEFIESLRSKYVDKAPDFSQEQVTIPEPDYGDTIMKSILNDAQQPPISNEQATAHITTNPQTKEDAKTVINQSTDVPRGIKKEGEKFFNQSTEEVQKGLEDIQAKKAAGKELGPVDKFLDALTFFIPSALGAAIGGALGGTEGAVAGASNAQGLYGSYLDSQYKQIELGQKQQELNDKRLKEMAAANQIDLDKTANFVIKGTDELVWQGVKAGKPILVDINGNDVDPKNVVAISTAASREIQAAISARTDSSIELRKDTLLNSNLNSFLNRGRMPKIKEVKGALSLLNDVIKSPQGITEGFISTWVAKSIQGQAGVLTEKDVKRAEIPLPKGQSIQSAVTEYFTGDMTAEKKQKAIELFKIIDENATKEMKKQVKGFAKSRAKILSTTEADLEDKASLELGLIDFGNMNDIKLPSANEAAELLKKRQKNKGIK